MFSPQIVDSDAFLEMSPSAQNLYFHLGMRADDDGFVGNPRKILRMVGGNEDDLKILIVKRFILCFDSGVIVIKHWLIHNQIRKDRYNETRYLEEKKSLIIKENKSYTELGQPSGNHLETQYRLGKGSIGKVSNTLQPEAAQEEKKNPKIKELIDFFYRASQCIQGVAPIIDGGKLGRLLKVRLEKNNIEPERLEMYAIWYLSQKKRYKDTKEVWHEQFKNTPDLSVMLSTAFMNQLVSDEKNAITFIQDNLKWVDEIYKKSKKDPVAPSVDRFIISGMIAGKKISYAFDK